MLHGFDISHWQGAGAVRKAMEIMPDAKFAIIKATEGKDWTDADFYNNMDDAKTMGLLRGCYHYARPEKGNSPIQEAENFVAVIKDYIGDAILCLDFEGSSHRYGWTWAIKWLRRVYELTGVKPLIYLSGAFVKNYTPIADEDFGLWIAAWTEKDAMKKFIKGWEFFAMWQYTDNGGKLDANWFNGNENQFMEYCKVTATSPDVAGSCGCDCRCECCCRKNKE